MSRFKKYALKATIIIGITLIFCFVYLFIDSPYPSYSIARLIKTESKNIPIGKSFAFTNDSLHKNITSKGEWFVDQNGRVMILHGINVGANSKLPFKPSIPTHQKKDFYETVYSVSFTGRPFPLSEADDHFKRLHEWGYRFVRLIITWEAIEHAGPNRYDEEYLNYIQAIVKKAGDYNINVFIDPHQDAWSRFTGGDGAPYWTLEKVGFDPLKFNETGAAIIHNIKGDPFPKMIWPTNYHKLGAATMFTLFFGGNDFAPYLQIDSLSAQDFLQSHYINAIKQVAIKLKGLPNVIGFDTLNEPDAGYIGKVLTTYDILKNGVTPNPFEGMILGDGNSLAVSRFEFELTGAVNKGKVTVNPNKFSAWKNPATAIWKTTGVWNYNDEYKPVLLRPDYFTKVNGRQVDFSADYFKPFAIKFKEAIHSVDSTWLIFTEAALRHELPKFSETESEKMVNAGHWYDAATLLTKKYSSWFGIDVVEEKPVFGKRAIRHAFHNNMAHKKAETNLAFGNQPTLVGEFGIPFDLSEKSAYKTGDYSEQEVCLDRSFQAMESNQLSYTLWNYSSTNDHQRGDQWNGEDLSIYSLSKKKSSDGINAGGRALAAAVRVYPYKVAGKPIEYAFLMKEREFYLKYISNKSIQLPTEIFIPQFHFKKGFVVFSTAGKIIFDKASSLLLFTPETDGEQVIIIKATD